MPPPAPYFLSGAEFWMPLCQAFIHADKTLLPLNKRLSLPQITQVVLTFTLWGEVLWISSLFMSHSTGN